eukprot:5343766-Amphidinium_carterae.1
MVQRVWRWFVATLGQSAVCRPSNATTDAVEKFSGHLACVFQAGNPNWYEQNLGLSNAQIQLCNLTPINTGGGA